MSRRDISPFDIWESQLSTACCTCKESSIYYRVGSKQWEEWVKTVSSDLYSILKLANTVR
jgi:hypothetical protein